MQKALYIGTKVDPLDAGPESFDGLERFTQGVLVGDVGDINARVHGQLLAQTTPGVDFDELELSVHGVSLELHVGHSLVAHALQEPQAQVNHVRLLYTHAKAAVTLVHWPLPKFTHHKRRQRHGSPVQIEHRVVVAVIASANLLLDQHLHAALGHLVVQIDKLPGRIGHG